MPTADQRHRARVKARRARDLAAKLESAAGIVSDSERKRQASITSRTILIPALTAEQRKLRLALEQDDRTWLRYYFPDPPFGFWYEFTPQQAAMIEAIGGAIKHGGDQAIAASRGEGKTQITRRLTIKYVLSGQVRFAVLFAATAADATDSLLGMRTDIEESDLLHAMYPEVCEPVRRMEGVPQRAKTMLATGERFDDGRRFENATIQFAWCGNEIAMPNVPGAPSAGAIIVIRGLDSAVRGLNKKGCRPDVAIIDDPDTEDSARSQEQAGKLEKRIDRAIAGLGGQQRGIARVMLTTLQSRLSASYTFTDPVQKPSWKGRRFRYLLKPPTRADLWDEYVQMRRTNHQKRDKDGEPADPFARGAHRFYLEHREEMDAGAEVANPHRFNPTELGDGTQLEVSSLQRYYNEVARVGPEAVATEYDNDPPEETGVVESGITPYRIQRQVSGVPRRQIPPGCTILTQGIDVRKVALHWVVRAWRPEESGVWTGFTIDYGVTETNVQPGAAESAVDSAIVRALHDRREHLVDNPYTMTGSEILEPEYSLVDSGWRTEAIYQFCDEAGLGWYPAQGHGKSSGCAAVSFHAPTQSTPTKLIGWGYYFAARPGSGGAMWLVHMDADHWKAWEHDRWMSDPLTPGGLFMWGTGSGNPDRMSLDERAHHSYSRHICAEIEVEEPDKNGVMKRYWKAKSDNNHWLDASYRCDVAAAMAGVRLFGMPLPEVDSGGDDYTGPIIDLGR